MTMLVVDWTVGFESKNYSTALNLVAAMKFGSANLNSKNWFAAVMTTKALIVKSVVKFGLKPVTTMNFGYVAKNLMAAMTGCVVQNLMTTKHGSSMNSTALSSMISRVMTVMTLGLKSAALTSHGFGLNLTMAKSGCVLQNLTTKHGSSMNSTALSSTISRVMTVMTHGLRLAGSMKRDSVLNLNSSGVSLLWFVLSKSVESWTVG